MIKDLTQGKPLRLLLVFSLPMLLGNLFQQLYNMVDSMVVGRFVSQDALAAVGSSFPVVFLAVSVASGTEMGCTVVISQLFGARRIREMKSTVSTSLISLGAIGLCAALLGELLSEPLLRLLRTDPLLMDDALVYLRVYFGGAVFLFLYNALKGIHTALGDSRTPLLFLILSSGVNIALDLVFVLCFRLGVAGVAWATLIAQGISAALSFLVLLKRLRRMTDESEPPDGAPFRRFHPAALRHILRVGVPSVLQQSVVSIGLMCMQGLVNSYGKVFVAGYTAATKIDSLAMMPNINFSNAMSSYAAQNIGADRYERVTKGYRASLLMSLLFSLLITGSIFLFGPELLQLFLKKGEAGSAMGYGMSYMRTVSLFYFVMGVMFVGNGLLRGAGDMSAFLISSMANLFSRVAVAYGLSRLPSVGQAAVWWSIPIGWGIGALITSLRVMSGKWKSRKLIGQAPKPAGRA